MTRLVYWSIILIVIPATVMALTLIFGPTGGGAEQIKFSAHIFFYVIIFGFPILSTIRLRYLKYSWKDILLTYIPFNGKGWKIRMREHFGK